MIITIAVCWNWLLHKVIICLMTCTLSTDVHKVNYIKYGVLFVCKASVAMHAVAKVNNRCFVYQALMLYQTASILLPYLTLSSSHLSRDWCYIEICIWAFTEFTGITCTQSVSNWNGTVLTQSIVLYAVLSACVVLLFFKNSWNSQIL